MLVDCIGIDIGVTACGYAHLKINNRATEKPVVVKTKVIKGISPEYWLGCIEMTNMVELFINEIPDEVKYIFAEEPRLMGGSKGMAAAGKGDLTHLAYHLGTLGKMANNLNIEFIPIPTSWKGTMDDKKTYDRILRSVGREDKRGDKILSHAIDAVGIGVCGFYGTDMENLKIWKLKHG